MSANKLQWFDYAFIPKQLEWIDLHQVVIIIVIIIIIIISSLVMIFCTRIVIVLIELNF